MGTEKEDQIRDFFARIRNRKDFNEMPDKPVLCGGPEHCESNDSVQWNPYNKVVQCHRCGQIYVPERLVLRSRIDME